MRLVRGIISIAFVLFWLGAAALWVRSYWRSDDIFLIHSGDGSEHLRIDRGKLSLIHTSPTSPNRRFLIGQMNLIAGRSVGQREDIAVPALYSTHRQWRGFSLDSISSAQIASMQAARAAEVLKANRAAFAALQDRDAAYIQFDQALSITGRSGNRALQENLSITYWQMRAAQEHAAAMRAAQLRIASTPVPTLTPQWHVSFHIWCLLVVSSIPIAIQVWRAHAKRRRIERGLCDHCGYDLHANTSGICPECGTRVTIVLCRSITLDGERVLSIRPATI